MSRVSGLGIAWNDLLYLLYLRPTFTAAKTRLKRKDGGSVAGITSQLSSASPFIHRTSGIILLKQNKSSFKWRHFEPSLILLCVRRYCRYRLSYRDPEEMMWERGLTVDRTTAFRWVRRYAPELNKRMRPYLKMSGTSYRLDETHVKVGKEWKYLYRAVDSVGNAWPAG